MAKQVTMRDIAKAMNTSVVTVSNAISEKAGVSETLRREILRTAEELGYCFPQKTEGRREKSLMAGIICSRSYMSEESSFYWEMYRNTVNEASRRGMITMLEILEMDEEPPLSSGLSARNDVDGFLVIGQIDDRYLNYFLEKGKRPVVLLDFCRPEYHCDAVMSNNYIGAYRITKYLTDHGHRQIGFVGTGRTSFNVVERYYGFCRCMREQGLIIRPEWLLEDRELRTEHPKIRLPEKLPSAFVCSSDYAAGILYNELTAHGVRVPEDVSLIGYDDYLYGNTFSRELTTYRVDLPRMAGKAVELLERRLNAPNLSCGVYYVDSEIIERSSVRSV